MPLNNDLGFGRAHPAVQLLFFVSAIGFSMFIAHPVSIAVSLICAFVYSAELTRGKNLIGKIAFSVPLVVFTALVNTAFNHRGVVVLAYFPSGNPLTLESVLNGFMAAGTVLSVIFWFSCLNRVFTSDRVIYVFGKTAPSLALVLTMALGFVPLFLKHIKLTYDAQKCMGAASGGIKDKVKNGINVLSVTVTWALENAADTADSMVSRGYGTGERTFFSVFKWEKRDTLLAVIIGMLSWIILAGISLGDFYWSRVFLGENSFTPQNIGLQCVYALMMLVPFICDMAEKAKWNSMHKNLCEGKDEN